MGIVYYISRYDLKKGIPYAPKSGSGGGSKKLSPLSIASGPY